MAGSRTVSVKLEADVSEYTAKLAKAAAATRQLGSSSPNVKVDADTAGASAKLTSVGRDVKQLDGKTARVKVDVNDTGAMQRAAQNVSTLMSAAIATSPALIGIGAAAAAGIGAIAPLAASAGAGLGVLALGFSGVGDAVKLLQQQHDAETAASLKSGASQVASTQQIASAQASLANARANAAASAVSASETVAKAVRAEKDAETSAAEGVASAQASAIKGVKSALDQQEQAEKDLTSAQRTARQAQDDLTSARKTAQQQIEDTANSVADNAIAQRQAVLDLKDAQTALDKARATGNADDIARAQIAYDSQIQRQKELVVQGKRLGDQQAENTRTGVDGSQQVVAAQQKLVDANQKVAEADRNARNAAEQVQEARADGAAKVAKAQEEGARKVADAQQAVADAARAQAEQQRQSAYSIQQAQAAVQAAMSSTANQSQSSLDLIDAKLGDVGASTLTFAKYVDSDLKPAFKRLQDVAAAGLLPGVQAGLDDLLKQEPRITGFVSTFANALGGLAGDSLKRLSDPQWSKFFDTLERQGVPQLQAMWHTGDNVAEAFASILTAFSPMATNLSRGIEGLSEDFAAWSANLGSSDGFHSFVAYVQENWPKVEAIIGNVAGVVGKLIEAGAPIGSELLSGFQLLSDVLSALPVPVVQALLEAFLGYKAVQSVVGIINGVATSMLALRQNVEGLPGKVSALTDGLGGGTGKVNEFGIAADGTATKAGRFATAAGSASDALGKVGKIAGIGGIAYMALESISTMFGQSAEDIQRFVETTQAIGGPNVDGQIKSVTDAIARQQDVVDEALIHWKIFGIGIFSNEDAKDAQNKIDALNGELANLQHQKELDGIASGQSAQATVNALATQATGYADFTTAASGQLSTYQQLLSDKQQKEQETAQKTADTTADATDSWKNYVKDASVSLDEYAAKLTEQTTNHENWRANIVDVTKRGGAEVGTILFNMGEDGEAIVAQMANASDADFERMKEAAIAHAHEMGTGVQNEIQTGLNIAAQVAADGGKATAEQIAKQLGLGVGEVQRIAGLYGVTLADSINPIMLATGHPYVRVAAGSEAAHMGGYAEGGYTGDGGKYEPAGIVHRGEFVVDKEKTAKHLPLLEALHSGQLDGIPGYANGGKVGLIALGHRLQSMGALVAENPSFPPLDMHGHGATSLHYTGDAIDVNTRPGTSALEQRELAPMAALAQSLGFRTIFMAPDHYSHLHIDDGAAAGSIGSGGGPAVVLPTPPSTAPYGPPLSTAADAVMQTAYDAASSWVASNTASGDTGAGSYGGGSMRELGRQIAASMGFGNQFGAIDSIFTRESSWNPNAQNPNSTAYGIPQFLNSTWAQYGGKTSVPSAQIRDGIQYMVDRYGSPNGAKAFWDSHHWYDQGGIASGVGFMAKNTLEPERVLSPRETQAFEQMVSREFSGASSGAGGAAPITVSLEGATVTGTFDFGSDGLVRLVDGRIEGQFQDLRRQTIRT